jgi:hypothetical protein
MVTRTQLDKLAARVDEICAVLFPQKEYACIQGPDGWDEDLVWERHYQLHPEDHNAKLQMYIPEFGELTPAECLELASDKDLIRAGHRIEKNDIAWLRMLREEVAAGRHPDLKYRRVAIIWKYLREDGTMESDDEAAALHLAQRPWARAAPEREFRICGYCIRAKQEAWRASNPKLRQDYRLHGLACGGK